MLNTIQAVKVQNHHIVALRYQDGVTVEVDFTPIIEQGGIFSPLADPDFFARVEIGERGRYLSWPDDLEFCADALRVGQGATAIV